MKLKLMSSVIIICVNIASFAAWADKAAGIVIGDPTGVSARFGIQQNRSIEAALAFSTGTYEGLHTHVTYLWDRARSFKTSEGPIEMYYGLGARLITINHGKYDGDVAIGPRAPLGLLYNFNNPDIEIFGEIAAGLDLSPRVDVDLDAGIGFRIRF